MYLIPDVLGQNPHFKISRRPICTVKFKAAVVVLGYTDYMVMTLAHGESIKVGGNEGFPKKKQERKVDTYSA